MKTSIKWIGLVAVVVAMSSVAYAQRGGGRTGRPTDAGVIQAISADGETITLDSRVAGAVTIVKLDDSSRLVEYVDADVSQLKVGDFISVIGVPVKLQAAAIEIGGSVQQLLASSPGRRGGNAPTPWEPTASGRLGGTVTSLQPLTVDFRGLTIEIATAPDARVLRQQPLTDKAALKVGAKICILGQRTGDTVTARTLILDATTGGMPTQNRGGHGGGHGAAGPDK